MAKKIINKRTSWYVKCDNVYSCEPRREATAAERQQYTSPGYTSPVTYGTPVYVGADYAELTDEDANLPF